MIYFFKSTYFDEELGFNYSKVEIGYCLDEDFPQLKKDRESIFSEDGPIYWFLYPDCGEEIRDSLWLLFEGDRMEEGVMSEYYYSFAIDKFLKRHKTSRSLKNKFNKTLINEL